MTTTQRQRPSREGPPPPDPASRGLILVAVAVALGVILLIQGGGVGFDRDDSQLEIGADGGGAETESPTTTEAPPETSVPPAELRIVALNAAGIDGYAGQTQQFLSVQGYTSVSPITAASPTEQTTLHFAEGYEIDALAVAQLFQLEMSQLQPLAADAALARDPAEFPPDTAIALELGPDVAGIIEGASPAEQPEGGTETGEATDAGAGGE